MNEHDVDLRARYDAFEPGDRTALVAVDHPDLQNAVFEQLASNGYKIHTAISVEDAALKLRSEAFHVTVVYENFNHADMESNQILAELRSLPMDVRRGQFVAVLGAGMETGNAMQAFRHSVDFCCGLGDVENLGLLLRRALERKTALYKPFRAALDSVASA